MARLAQPMHPDSRYALDEPGSPPPGASFLQSFAFAVFRSRLLVLAIVVLSTLAGFGVAVVQPNIFESEAKLLIQVGAREFVTPDRAISSAGTGGPTPRDTREAIQNELEILTSPELFRRVVEKLGAARVLCPFDPAAEDDATTPLHTRWLHQLQSWWFAGGATAPAADRPPEVFAAEVLRVNVAFLTDPMASTIRLYYRTHDPRLARDVLQAVVEVCRERHLEVFGLAVPHKVLDDHFQESHRHWVSASDALAAFRTEHGVFDPETMRAQLVEQMAVLDNQLADDAAALCGLRARLGFLSAEIALEPPTVARQGSETEQSNPIYTWLLQQVYSLKGQRVTLEADRRGTEAEVAQVRRLLEDLIDEGEAMLKQLQPMTAAQQVTLVIDNPRHVRLRSRIDEVQEQIDGIQAEQKRRHARREEIRSRLADVDGLDGPYQELVRNALIAETRLGQMASQLEQIKALKSLDDLDVSNLRVIQAPTLPLAKIGPRRLRTLMLAALAGCVGACALAYLRLQLGGRIRRRADILRIRDVELLTVCPEDAHLRRLRPGRYRSGSEPLPTGLRRAWVDIASRRTSDAALRVAFVGPEAGSGVSLLAASVALGLARGTGWRVLLLDADGTGLGAAGVLGLDEVPTLSSSAGASSDASFSGGGDLVPGEVAEVTGLPGLRVLRGIGPGDQETLPSARLGAALRAARKSTVDFVIVDLPSISAQPDVRILRDCFDVVVCVFRAEQTTMEAAQDLVQAFSREGTRVLAILNRYRSPFPRWVRDPDVPARGC